MVDEPVVTVVTEQVVPAAQPGAGAAGFTDLAAANVEIARLRAENAGRRVDNRDLQGQIDDLKQQVPSADVAAQLAELQTQLQRFQAASAAGISPELLVANDQLATAKTADEMRAAREAIARLTAPAAPPVVNPPPPGAPSQPLSLEEQTAAALKAGNLREVERLNAEKLAGLRAGGTT